MKKRLLSFALCAALVAVLAAPALAVGMDGIVKTRRYDGQFSDIAGKWYESAIADLYEYGLVEGRGDGSVDPEARVTLSEVIALCTRIHAAYYEKTIPAAANKWYDGYVAYALENGVATEALTANMEREATRGEAALLFAKALPAQQYERVNKELTFFDVMQLDPYYDAVALLSGAGIVTGYVDMRFLPEKGITRAEALTMADRVVNKDARVGYHTNSARTAGKRDEEVGDYVTFDLRGVAVFTMNRRDEGFTLSVALADGVATFAGLCELREGVGMVCPLGDRVVSGSYTGINDLTGLVFSYDNGLRMTLIGAMDSSGKLYSDPGTVVVGALSVGVTLTAVN